MMNSKPSRWYNHRVNVLLTDDNVSSYDNRSGSADRTKSDQDLRHQSADEHQVQEAQPVPVIALANVRTTRVRGCVPQYDSAFMMQTNPTGNENNSLTGNLRLLLENLEVLDGNTMTIEMF